jgi:hypothetical protein
MQSNGGLKCFGGRCNHAANVLTSALHLFDFY